MSLRGKPGARALNVLRKLRECALSFPETREDHPWERSAFKRWMEESYLAIAPLSVLKQLEPEGRSSTTARKKRRLHP